MPDDASDEINDSTDWLSTSTPALSELDAALRCQVCKDFYNTPMVTTCSHTFCSICIRRCLSNDGKCPICRAADQASKLRSNGRLGEAVEAFKISRRILFDLARRRNPSESPESATRRKRKAAEADLDGGRTLRRSTRTRQQSSQQGLADALVILDSEDDEYIPNTGITSRPSPPKVDDGLVPCPICGRRMKEDNVYRHLDTCPGPDAETQSKSITQQPSLSRISAPVVDAVPKVSRISQLNYTLLTETQLRKKLVEFGIPASGSKLNLERRHKEWVNIFNANCDSTRPKPVRDLLKDLNVWERTVDASNSTPATIRGQAPQTTAMSKDFDTAQWGTRHRDHFHDLITQARLKAKAVKTNQVESSAKPALDPITPLENAVNSAVTTNLDDCTVEEDQKDRENAPVDGMWTPSANHLLTRTENDSRYSAMHSSNSHQPALYDRSPDMKRIPILMVEEEPIGADRLSTK